MFNVQSNGIDETSSCLLSIHSMIGRLQFSIMEKPTSSILVHPIMPCEDFKTFVLGRCTNKTAAIARMFKIQEKHGCFTVSHIDLAILQHCIFGPRSTIGSGHRCGSLVATAQRNRNASYPVRRFTQKVGLPLDKDICVNHVLPPGANRQRKQYSEACCDGSAIEQLFSTRKRLGFGSSIVIPSLAWDTLPLWVALAAK